MVGKSPKDSRKSLRNGPVQNRTQAYIFKNEEGWQAHLSDCLTGYSVEDPSPLFLTKEGAITWAQARRAGKLVIDQL